MTRTCRIVDGPRLQALREDRFGWSQADLAVEVGVSPRTVIRWEAGETQPSPRVFLKLAEVLKVQLDDFSARIPVEDAA